MAERCGGVLGRGRAVHEGDRPERRIANRGTREREREAAADRVLPANRRLHQEVVRMLPVDERHAVQRLADLEDLAIAVIAEGERIEAQHQVELQRAAGGRPAEHAHPPVLRAEILAAARAALVVVGQPGDAVLHEMPRHGGGCAAGAGAGCWCGSVWACAGSGRVQKGTPLRRLSIAS